MVIEDITLSADGALIEAASQRARAEHITLNEAFRRWLATYAQTPYSVQRGDDVLAQLQGCLKARRKLIRDEMNTR